MSFLNDFFGGSVRSYSSKYISGLILSNNGTDAAKDIDISIGTARDIADSSTMVLGSPMTKKLDVVWGIGTDAGGLFSGSVAADTWYAVFIIKKDSDGTTDIGFDTSETAVNRPLEYSSYRKIGWILTDIGSDILGFIDTELAGGAVERFWDIQLSDYSATISSTSRQLVTVSAPSNSLLQISGSLGYLANAVRLTAISTSLSDNAVSGLNFDYYVTSTNTSHTSPKNGILVDNSNQIAVKTDSANSVSFGFKTIGFTDRRVS